MVKSYTFDFFEITVYGLGVGVANISATLAFDVPAGESVIGNGGDAWFSFFGVFSGNYLRWTDMPQTIMLSSGGYLDVEFNNMLRIGFGNSMVTSVTSTYNAAPVPEPGTLLLLSSGIIGFAVLRRRKKKGTGTVAF